MASPLPAVAQQSYSKRSSSAMPSTTSSSNASDRCVTIPGNPFILLDNVTLVHQFLPNTVWGLASGSWRSSSSGYQCHPDSSGGAGRSPPYPLTSSCLLPSRANKGGRDDATMVSGDNTGAVQDKRFKGSLKRRGPANRGSSKTGFKTREEREKREGSKKTREEIEKEVSGKAQKGTAGQHRSVKATGVSGFYT